MMMTKLSEKEVAEKVMDLIEDVSGDPDVRSHPDDDLFELGFLDSMAAIELLVALEDDLGVSIAPTEVARAEMNTPNRIAAQVEMRL